MILVNKAYKKTIKDPLHKNFLLQLELEYAKSFTLTKRCKLTFKQIEFAFDMLNRISENESSKVLSNALENTTILYDKLVELSNYANDVDKLKEHSTYKELVSLYNTYKGTPYIEVPFNLTYKDDSYYKQKLSKQCSKNIKVVGQLKYLIERDIAYLEHSYKDLAHKPYSSLDSGVSLVQYSYVHKNLETILNMINLMSKLTLKVIVKQK